MDIETLQELKTACINYEENINDWIATNDDIMIKDAILKINLCLANLMR